jgi:hypothetical protein
VDKYTPFKVVPAYMLFPITARECIILLFKDVKVQFKPELVDKYTPYVYAPAKILFPLTAKDNISLSFKEVCDQLYPLSVDINTPEFTFDAANKLFPHFTIAFTMLPLGPFVCTHCASQFSLYNVQCTMSNKKR